MKKSDDMIIESGIGNDKKYLRAEICYRSQHAVGKFPHQGPGNYIAVIWSYDRNVVFPYNLNIKQLKKLKIEYVYCGSYYWNRKGPKSSYALALNRAVKIQSELEKNFPVKELLGYNFD